MLWPTSRQSAHSNCKNRKNKKKSGSRSGPQQRGTKFKVSASTLHSRAPKRGRECYITPAFSGIPNAKRGEENQKWSPTKGNKIGSGCLTPAFSGAQNRAEMLHHPCIVGGPQRQAREGKSEVVPNTGEKNWKWLPHPCLLGGPKEGGNATSPLHSRGSPTPSAGRKIRSGPQQRKIKLEVAASPLPSQGPKRGRKCYVTPKFSGIPNAKRREEKQKWSPMKGSKKTEMAASPLPSRGIRRGRKCYVTPCILGGPQRQARGGKSEVLANKGGQN